MLQPISIIAELEEAVRSGSAAKRISALRQIKDLFIHDGERLSRDQIKTFDDVLCHLAGCVETWLKAEIRAQFTSLECTPSGVIECFACDDQIDVLGTTLASSSHLTTSPFVKIGKTKGQDHLFAILGLADLPEVVTDVIIDRAEPKISRKFPVKADTRLSGTSYRSMFAHAESDDELNEILGIRVNLPTKFLRDLLRRATDAVRARLALIAPAELREEIRHTLKAIASATLEERPAIRDFSQAEGMVRRMKNLNELNDTAIIGFVHVKKFDEVAASLAILNSAPTNMMARVLEGFRADLILIPCKSAGLSTAALEMILRNRSVKRSFDEEALKLALKDYNKLSKNTADRAMRFWLLHDKIEK